MWPSACPSICIKNVLRNVSRVTDCELKNPITGFSSFIKMLVDEQRRSFMNALGLFSVPFNTL